MLNSIYYYNNSSMTDLTLTALLLLIEDELFIYIAIVPNGIITNLSRCRRKRDFL